MNRLTGLTLFIRPEGETAPPRLLTMHRVIQDYARRKMGTASLAARQDGAGNWANSQS